MRNVAFHRRGDSLCGGLTGRRAGAGVITIGPAGIRRLRLLIVGLWRSGRQQQPGSRHQHRLGQHRQRLERDAEHRRPGRVPGRRRCSPQPG